MNDDQSSQEESAENPNDQNSSNTDGSSSNRILNQDEIDSLLGFNADGDGPLGKRGIHAILNSGMIAYERLPMLDVVFDRLVRMLSTSLRNFTSDNVEISLDKVVSIRFGEYLNTIPTPSLLSVCKAEEWDNYILLLAESPLIYSIIDVLLGGRRGATSSTEGRPHTTPYTTIERKLVERMLGVVLNDMSAAFDPLSRVHFRFDRLETNPKFATITRHSNAAIVAQLQIDMDGRGGRLQIIIPYATLEPIRELLLQMFMGEKFGRDSIWENHLATELWSTDIAIRAVLDQQDFQLKEILEWKVGTQIMLNCNENSDIMLCCGETAMFTGKMGKRGSKLAVCIDQKRVGTKP